MKINSGSHRELANQCEHDGRTVFAMYHRGMAWIGDKINTSDSIDKESLKSKEIVPQDGNRKVRKVGEHAISRGSSGSTESKSNFNPNEFEFTDIYPDSLETEKVADERNQKADADSVDLTPMPDYSLSSRNILEAYDSIEMEDQGIGLIESAKKRLLLVLPNMEHSSVETCSTLDGLESVLEGRETFEMLAKEYLSYGLSPRIEELHTELKKNGKEGNIREFYDFYLGNKSKIERIESLVKDARKRFLTEGVTKEQLKAINNEITNQFRMIPKEDQKRYLGGMKADVRQQMKSMIP